MNDTDSKSAQIGQGISELSNAVEGAMVEISAQVGRATIDVSRTMVDNARDVTEVSQNFVKAAGKLAMMKASQKFEGLLEEATLEHLETLAVKRAEFEEKAKNLPAGAAKKFALRMAEKISEDETKILDVAMAGGGLALLSENIQSPALSVPGGPSGLLKIGARGSAFAPPPTSEDVENEITSDPIIVEGAGGSDDDSTSIGNEPVTNLDKD